jgi:hypothetical protein
LTLCLFSERGFVSYFDLIDSDDIPPLMLGVVGVLGALILEDSTDLSLTELVELLLPVEIVSESKIFSFVVKEGFF